MPQHPGLWLTQVRLNSSQTLLSEPDLLRLPELTNLPKVSRVIEDQVVHLHLFAGSYSFWAAAADYLSGSFVGFSRDHSSDPGGRWGVMPYTRLLGVRRLIKIDGVMTRIPLERDQHFLPMSLEEALRWE